jgi:hypothetical protein
LVIDPEEVPGLDIAPGVGEAQLLLDPMLLDMLELLAPALGDGHGDAAVPEVV